MTCVLFQVHSQLRDIVDNHSSVWAKVSFKDTWPSPNTLWLFERYNFKKNRSIMQCLSEGFYLEPFSPHRAAEKGNFEAATKLGIAYLYNEGRKLA